VITVITNQGEFSGRSVGSIVRREFGRKARFVCERPLGQNPEFRGQVCVPIKGEHSVESIVAHVRGIHGPSELIYEEASLPHEN